jgi:hypothetical protein
MTDTVEKVRSMAPPRNNRNDEADFLNRSCAFDAGFESMLLGDPSQNPFSTVSVKNVGPGTARLAPNFRYGRKVGKPETTAMCHNPTFLALPEQYE